MRVKYKLLKDTPEIKKGGIVQEQCDDGTQDFEFIGDKKFKVVGSENIVYARKIVTSQPKWFERVNIINIDSKEVEVSKEQLKKIKKILK